jgi:hypothetical protein
MAKKRKAARASKAARPKARSRGTKGRAGSEIDPMNLAIAVLVLILIGLGFYFYQSNQKTASAPGAPTAVAVEKK